MSRVAVITGANRGIGAEIAAQLEHAGLHVVKTSREPGGGERREQREHGFETLDVTRPEQARALVGRLPGGHLDVLVNNAGASFDGFDADVARRTLDTNFAGAMHVTDALLPAMRSGGRIVMVSSGMGNISCIRGPQLRERILDPELTRAALIEIVDGFVRDVAAGKHAASGWPSNAYSVSKVAMNALVRVLARELAGDPRRILVNAVDPGWVRTRMGGQSAPRSVQEGAKTAVWLALLPDGGPMGGFFRDEKAIPW
jgi:NAD(P)-dependent dehydrogenase (short-subunit alcohol dehydrogenase family)